MWDRRTLKERGKSAFKANYWLAVLVAFIILLLSGGGVGLLGGSVGVNFNLGQTDITQADNMKMDEIISTLKTDPSAAVNEFGELFKQDDAAAVIGVIIAVVFGAVALVSLVHFVINLLVLNPLRVGCQSFFVRNAVGQGELNNLERGFMPNWGGNVKTMFLRDLFLFLWGLLFIFPAIIKSYSYRMVPFILADHPELSGRDVITMSRQMMNGSKWRAFVLDLSFIGWEILSALTLGILGIFYVAPYKCSTDAELYHALKNEIRE